MRMRATSILILILLSTVAYSQSKKKNKKQAKTQEQSAPAPNTLDPNAPAPDKYEPKKKSKKPSKGPTFESEQQYYERTAQLEKQRRKNERYLDKPQYSDPSYFGHKRPPKKRPPGKMKYCKVCGLRH
jgi:hypothetical protein